MKTKRSSSALAVWEERKKENKTPQLSSQLPNVELLKRNFYFKKHTEVRWEYYKTNEVLSFIQNEASVVQEICGWMPH